MKFKNYVLNALSISVVDHLISDSSVSARMDIGVPSYKHYYINGKFMQIVFDRKSNPTSEYSEQTWFLLSDGKKPLIMVIINGKGVYGNRIGTLILEI